MWWWSHCRGWTSRRRAATASVARAGIIACVAAVTAAAVPVTHWPLVPVARAMCDRLAALDGLVPPAAVARSTPSSPNAYRAVVQQQQLEKTASVPDLQKSHVSGDERAAGEVSAATEHRAAPASACVDSKSDGCLIEAGRAPVTSLSGTFLTSSRVSVSERVHFYRHAQCARISSMGTKERC